MVSHNRVHMTIKAAKGLKCLWALLEGGDPKSVSKSYNRHASQISAGCAKSNLDHELSSNFRIIPSFGLLMFTITGRWLITVNMGIE